MTSPGGTTRPDSDPVEVDEEELPPFAVQMSQQLGGVRGLVESSIPVTVFVVLNWIGSQTERWSLRESLLASVGFAVLMAVFRLTRRQPVRHAVNGVFGILVGAAIAWRSGEAKDFYLPGMIISAGYAAAMIVSVVARRPLVGFIWSVTLDGGSPRWYQLARLRRLFGWLTLLWAVIYLTKVGIQFVLYLADQENLLGIARIVFGWPPYALLLALTVWLARREIRAEEAADGDPAAGGRHLPAAAAPTAGNDSP